MDTEYENLIRTHCAYGFCGKPLGWKKPNEIVDLGPTPFSEKGNHKYAHKARHVRSWQITLSRQQNSVEAH